MSRNGCTTVIALGLHPTKKARFYCHGCKVRFEGHIEYSRLKILNENGSCAGMRTYCELCTEEILEFEKRLNMANDINNTSDV